MNRDLLTKYSVPVPRYTSYPPANFFSEEFTAEHYRTAIIESNKENPQHISIYIHIPFCYKMCYYCGCNSMVLKDDTTIANYITTLKKEIRMVLPLLDHSRKVSQIHYGGGTPTSQPVSVLKEINDSILSEFDCIDEPEIAIECHPGYLDRQYWTDLIDAGFNRISLGIQDFDTDVLKASNRAPSLMPIEEVVDLLKSRNIPINMDFIYGLPLQTPESFANTIQKAISLNPDRVVTFSYAHVPWVNPLQKKLEEAGLPTVSTKSAIYQTAKTLLLEAGYKAIGLDHFVRQSDELNKAVETKSLHRNFQGYCTRRTTGQVYAFGTTGISQLATGYSQNTKSLKEYVKLVNEGKSPTIKGYILNRQEQITREVITQLMCNYTIRWQDIADSMDATIEEVRASINYDEKVLLDLVNDKIIVLDDTQMSIQPNARPFVRNVAASLDKLYSNKETHYSKSI